MTSTVPRQADVRACRLYRFYVEHPVTGEEVLGYVGETVRQPFERLMEHIDTQPWMDTVTRWERDPRVFAGKRAVLDAEAEAIRVGRPLYNVVGNLDNEDRIIPPVAIRQRRARDARQREPRWVHPDDRVPGPPVRPARLARSWSPVRIKVGLLSAGWTLTEVTTWAALDHYDLPVTWATVLTVGTLAYAALLVWTWAGFPTSRRQVRRAWRRHKAARHKAVRRRRATR